MQYCPECKRLFEEPEKKCPVCSCALRGPHDGDFIYLLTVEKDSGSRVTELLSGGGIPYRSRAVDQTGKEYRILVPFERLEECRKLLKEVLPQTEKEEFEPMSDRKRFFWRVVSAVLFFLLIWAVVALTDMASGFITSFFQR